jgi:hypothetical protein
VSFMIIKVKPPLVMNLTKKLGIITNGEDEFLRELNSSFGEIIS